MYMSKLTPFFSAVILALLGGCSQAPPPKIVAHTDGGMDSPIIISDESHVRHKSAKGDFQAAGGGNVTAYSESGDPIIAITCAKMTAVSGPTSSANNCISGFNPGPADAGWKIDIWDQSNAQGNHIMTVTPIPASATPSNCKPNVVCGVTVDFQGYKTKQGKDNSGDTSGSDITEYNSKVLPVFKAKFVSATFSNNGDSMVLNCNAPNGHDCKIRISYY